MDYASFLKLSLAARRAFVDAAGASFTGFEPLKDSHYVAERAGAAQSDLERDRAELGSPAAARVTSEIPEHFHPSVGLLFNSMPSTAGSASDPQTQMDSVISPPRLPTGRSRSESTRLVR